MEAKGPNSAQIDYWNGAAGDRWVRHAHSQDAMVDTFGLVAMEACDIHAGHTVLDIGCGVGTTTLQIARRVGPEGRVLGVDLSGQMLRVGRERLDASGLGNVTLEHADIAAYPFEAESIDRAFSRFGVMFFSDPVAAFGNIRRAMTPGGRLAFVCWQAVKQNPWMKIPIDTTLQFVEPPPLTDPEAPGPVSFADPERIRRILSDAGFDDLTIEGIERDLPVAADGRLAAQRLIQMGAASRLLANETEDIKRRVEDALCEGLAGYLTNGGVMLGGATWLVSAVAT